MVLIVNKNVSQRAFQKVAEEIQKNVINGNLKPGDFLPPENNLAKLFSTSRPTIREALRLLEQRGLILIKQGAGGGAIVKVDFNQFSESLDLLIKLKKITLQHLIEYRVNVEGIVAGIAAERSTSDDVKRLKNILLEAKDIVDKETSTWNDLRPLDIKIHIEIAKISQNPVFENSLKVIHENLMIIYEKYYQYDRKIMKENYFELCEIVTAIEKGLPDKAKSLAISHAERFAESTFEKIDSEIGSI